MKLPKESEMCPEMPPSVANYPGQIYIMPYWIPFESQKQFDTIKQMHDALRSKEISRKQEKEKNPNRKEWFIKTYTVALENGVYSCTCPGYNFRGKCKHINGVKEGQHE
jgi:hypothetical protein